MFSAFKLNQQGNSVQPCHTPFPILNQAQKNGKGERRQGRKGDILNAEFPRIARRDEKAFLDEQYFL